MFPLTFPQRSLQTHILITVLLVIWGMDGSVVDDLDFKMPGDTHCTTSGTICGKYKY